MQNNEKIAHWSYIKLAWWHVQAPMASSSTKLSLFHVRGMIYRLHPRGIAHCMTPRCLIHGILGCGPVDDWQALLQVRAMRYRLHPQGMAHCMSIYKHASRPGRSGNIECGSVMMARLAAVGHILTRGPAGTLMPQHHWNQGTVYPDCEGSQLGCTGVPVSSCTSHSWPSCWLSSDTGGSSASSKTWLSSLGSNS